MNSTDPSAGGGGAGGGGEGVDGGGAGNGGGGGGAGGGAGAAPTGSARRPARAAGRLRCGFAGLLAVSALAGDTRATPAGGVECRPARTRGSPMSAARGSGGGGRSSDGSACRKSSTR